MPTTRKVTVKPSGGDYASLAAAVAGEAADLVSLDRQLDIECYSMTDTAHVNIVGYTTDPTRHIRIYAAVGHRHVGAWDDTKYNLTLATSGTPGGCITNRRAYTRVEHLQVRNTRASPPQFNDCIYDEAGGVLIIGCITRGGYNGVSLGVISGIGGGQVRNSICYGAAQAGAYLSGTTNGFCRADSCTLIGGLYGLQATATINYPVARNVYAHGTTGGYGTPAGGLVTKVNCASSDTTATNNSGGGGVTSCINNVAHSSATFSSVTGGSEDYHLVPGSGLLNVGTDLSSTFTADIAGTTRSVPWDIGAFEFAPAPAIVPVVQHLSRLRRVS